MQIRQKYLNASLCKFVVNSLQHSETFDVSHDFLPLTIAELSTLKQVWFFGPPCMYTYWCRTGHWSHESWVAKYSSHSCCEIF